MPDRTLEQYLKNLRRSHNFSQEFVASHLNITRQTYSHYETGRITPPADSLYNLARLYGVPIESFLDLIIAYNINTDFVLGPQPNQWYDSDEFDQYMNYVNDLKNCKKIRYLNRQERMMLCYYELLDQRDKKDILTFMRIKIKNRKGE